MALPASPIVQRNLSTHSSFTSLRGDRSPTSSPTPTTSPYTAPARQTAYASSLYADSLYAASTTTLPPAYTAPPPSYTPSTPIPRRRTTAADLLPSHTSTRRAHEEALLVASAAGDIPALTAILRIAPTHRRSTSAQISPASPPSTAFFRVQDDQKLFPVHLAAKNNRAAALALLLDAGVAPINHHSAIWGTPLHVASQSGSLAAVRLLLSRGAALNPLTTIRAQTPLQLAAERGPADGGPETLAALLDAGADVNAGRPQSALHVLAEQGGRADEMAALLRRGARVDAPNRGGQTALVLAARTGDGEAVRLLLDARARVEVAEPVRGWRAVEFAARAGKAGVVRQLVAAGADIVEKDKFGGTVLHAAAAAGKAEVVRVLVELGADVGARDGKGRRADEVAEREGFGEIARFLRGGRAEW